MFSVFGQAFLLVVIVGVLGLLLSIVLILPGTYLVKRFTRVSEERRQNTAVLICLVLTAALIVLQLAMHFRMRSELEPLAREFAMDAHMEYGDVIVSDEIVARRNAQLNEHGYIHLGRWWAAYGYEQPDITTDGILYLWVPFL